MVKGSFMGSSTNTKKQRQRPRDTFNLFDSHIIYSTVIMKREKAVSFVDCSSFFESKQNNPFPWSIPLRPISLVDSSSTHLLGQFLIDPSKVIFIKRWRKAFGLRFFYKKTKERVIKNFIWTYLSL